jgi:citrate lyase beta subunit
MNLRQPIHTVYGGAHLFRSDVCRKLGAIAERAMTEYAPDPATMGVSEAVYSRVREKLRREPVENFHIDFEDGFGVRPDEEEDAAAVAAAGQVAEGLAAGSLPAFLGIRVKPFNAEWRARALRTLRIFMDAAGGRLPSNFVVVLPKITVVEQVSALADALEAFPGVGMELMVETPQALLLGSKLVEAARGRCSAVHFGAYDYTASLGITASRQSLMHPACDFARSMMQVQLAGTGVWLVDGGTNVLPAAPGGWKLHYDNVRHALDAGFYQGWDLHPAQLPARFAAVYSFFLEGLEAASTRLRNFVAQAAQSTQVAGVFDDAATGRGLVNYFLLGVNCGAIPESEIPALTGLTMDRLRTGSFL